MMMVLLSRGRHSSLALGLGLTGTIREKRVMEMLTVRGGIWREVSKMRKQQKAEI